jgi:hypothetical protein
MIVVHWDRIVQKKPGPEAVNLRLAGLIPTQAGTEHLNPMNGVNTLGDMQARGMTMLSAASTGDWIARLIAEHGTP